MGLLDLFRGKPAPQSSRPLARPMESPRPDPRGKNHFVVVILDSLRFDTFMQAEAKNILRVGRPQKRYSYASWTAPSHYNLLTGLLPHTSPPNVYASDYYKEDFYEYNRRLGAKGIEFSKMVPGLWLPSFLRDTLGYATHARVSLPVLNPRTGINRGFDSFQLMDSHNDMRAMLKTLDFSGPRPSFVLLNVGETHYPYARPDEDSSAWPRLHGVNGVFKKLEGQVDAQGSLIKDSDAPVFFDQARLDELRARQVDTVRYLDGVFAELYDLLPADTWLVVTSDHGELFGEAGYFGHGPILHDKVLEVPFLEGMRP